MKQALSLFSWLLLLALGAWLIVHGYREVELATGLAGLLLVVALVLAVMFRKAVLGIVQGPRVQATVAFLALFIGNIKLRNVLYSLPVFGFSLGFAALLLGLQHQQPLALKAAAVLKYWYVSELLAAILSPFIIWAFVRDDATPAWQRAIAAPVLLLCFGGILFFVKILQLVWAFVLLKCSLLWFQRPDVKEHMIGCAQGLVSVALWVVLGFIIIERPERLSGVLPKLPAESLPLGAAMLFGCAYYAALGLSEILLRPFLYAVYYFQPSRAADSAS